MTGTKTWRACAAAATGASHAEQGVGNCDAHRVARYGPSGLALVVADGVGSSAEAAAAAAVAVAAAARSLERHTTVPAEAEHPLSAHYEHARTAVYDARAAVRELTGALQLREEDLGTTLLVCLLGEDGATFAGLGDGFLALRASAPGAAPRHHLLSLDEQADAVNETPTLLHGGHTRVKTVRDPYLTGAALATDGVEALAIEDADAWTRLREGVIDRLLVHVDGARDSQQLYRDLVQERWDAASADDRTIVLAVRA